MVPFISVDAGTILDLSIRTRVLSIVCSLINNNINYWVQQLSVLGMMPSFMKEFCSLVNQSYQGNVTVVPHPSFQDYREICSNVTREGYSRAFQESYVCTLRKMSHIRAYFGIEREFNRYYERLR